MPTLLDMPGARRRPSGLAAALAAYRNPAGSLGSRTGVEPSGSALRPLASGEVGAPTLGLPSATPSSAPDIGALLGMVQQVRAAKVARQNESAPPESTAGSMSGGASASTDAPVTFEIQGPVTASVRAAISLARSQLGKPYVWGAEGPNSFDCSGLLQYVWAREGVSIPRVSQDQWRAGRAVARNALRPGDAVFFAGYTGGKGGPGHVAMYIGGGKIIEAPGRGKVVRISSLSSHSGYMGARRYAR